MSKHTIPVLKKSIIVLEAIAENSGDRTTKALSQTLKVPHSTTYRILQTYLDEGWIRPDAGGLFRLSFGLLPLLNSLVHQDTLIETVRKLVTKLSLDTGLTAKISIRQGHGAVTVFRAESANPTSVSVKVGASIPMVQGAAGSSLLSGLPKAETETIISEASEECWRILTKADLRRRLRDLARNGYCTYGHPSVFSISAPLIGADGQVLAAVTVLGFPHEFEKGRRKIILRQLLTAVTGCNRLIRGGLSARSAA